MSADQVPLILSACEKGLTDASVAAQYGVHPSAVRRLRLKHIGKRRTGRKQGTRVASSRIFLPLDITHAILTRPTSTYFAIARELKCSREYVSHVAAYGRRLGIFENKKAS